MMLRAIIAKIVEIEARWTLKKFAPKIIAVTGSVGKTSAKDAIFCALSPLKYIRKNARSFNTELGVPLTILGLDHAGYNVFGWVWNFIRGAYILFGDKYPEWLVLEVGADKPGDIERITKWLKPDIVVLTSLPELPVHIENFSSPEAVILEKQFLVDALKKDGVLVFCGDDGRVRTLSEAYDVKKISYGFGKSNQVLAGKPSVKYEDFFPVGLSFDVNFEDQKTSVEVVDTLGEPQVYALLSALSVGTHFGIDIKEIANNLKNYHAPNGRMRIHKAKNGAVIIDDSYNSSPIAAHSALDTLKSLKIVGKRMAVLGDMLELGRYSAHAHRVLGEHVARDTDVLVTIGVRAKGVAESAIKVGMKEKNVMFFSESELNNAIDYLENHYKKEDAIIVKGSRRLGLEKIIQKLCAE